MIATVLLVVHLLLAVSLICVVLLQKSEGGALGMGGGGMSGFMTGRSTANLLTRTTAIMAALFMVTSIVLAILAGGPRVARSVDDLPPVAPRESAPVPFGNVPAPATSGTPAPVMPALPAAPAEPSAPLAK
jgi:preprotein translocase subunit SecG